MITLTFDDWLSALGRTIRRVAIIGVLTSVSVFNVVAGTVNFDDVIVPDFGLTLVASNHYPAVQIQTMEDATDGLGIGDVFTASVLRDNFLLRNNPAAAISPPNLVLANELENGSLFNGSRELLLSFAVPVVSVSLYMDLTPEGAPGDLIRLLAVRSLGGNMYQIVGIASGLDNASTAVESFLTLAVPGGFTHAVFETTSEREGFDSLEFQSVPEPSSIMLMLCGLGGIGYFRSWRRRSAGCRPSPLTLPARRL